MVLHTLQMQHAWLLLVYTLLTLVNARVQRGLRGVKLFVLYNALALLGAVSVALRGLIPDFLSIVIGNVAVISAYSALFGSMDQLFGFPRRQRMIAAVWPSLGLVSMVWLGLWAPSTPGRLFCYSLVLALAQLHLAALLILNSRRRERMAWMPGSLLAALAIANLYRMALVVVQGAPVDYRDAGPGLAAIVGANACLQCGLMVSYVWMTAALLRRDLEQQASTDPLTGLLNRRALSEAARRLLRRAPGNAGCAVVLIDLDNFKPLNDLLGHGAGDDALLTVGRLLSAAVRPGDLVARTGGDEFVLLLPEQSLDEAYALAGVLRQRLEVQRFGSGSTVRRMSASFGVAEAHEGEEWNGLCTRCDRAMYRAKNGGGNAIECSLPEHFAHDQLVAAAS